MPIFAWRLLGGIALAVWIYLAWYRGSFWKQTQRLQPATPPRSSVSVSAVIPARNEAEVIGHAIGSLRAQTDHIVVVDDESTDSTHRNALAAGADEVITAGRRPPGWKGKLWAVSRGLASLTAEPDYLLLTDADIEYAPDAVAALIAKAEGGFDLVSVMVRLRTDSFAEKLLIPAFVFFFFELYPPAWVSDPRSRTAAAAGGVMLIRPATLAKAGGIASIRDALIDDCALARRVKDSGGRVWLGTSVPLIRSIRGYGGFAGIRAMIARAAFAQLNHSALLLVATICGLFLTYVSPVALMLSGDPLAVAFGRLVWLMSAALFFPVIREYKAPIWVAFSLPVIAVFYGVATLESAIRYWSGRGGEWKGRVQDARSD